MTQNIDINDLNIEQLLSGKGLSYKFYARHQQTIWPEDLDEDELEELLAEYEAARQLNPCPGYYEFKYMPPLCNFSQDIDRKNIGYCQGAITGGLPFSAELWLGEQMLNCSIILPNLGFDSDSAELAEILNLPKDNLEPLFATKQVAANGALAIGMANLGNEDDIEIMQQYVNILMEAELINFPDQIINASMMYLADISGHDFVQITITLIENNQLMARTSLSFQEFPGRPGWGLGEQGQSKLKLL